MDSITGELKLLGEAHGFGIGSTYSVIEVGGTHLTRVTVGSGLDTFLKPSVGKQVTLHLNRGRFLIGLDVQGRSYALKDGAGSAMLQCFLVGIFALLFGFLTFLNWGDMLLYGRGDGGSLLAGLLFAVPTFFAVRSVLRNWGTVRRLGEVKSKPGVILV